MDLSQAASITIPSSSKHHPNDPTTTTNKVINHLGPTPLTIDSNRKRRLLASKKKLLKYRPRSHKLVFDDEGNPHEVYEFEDEEKFKAKGPVERQRDEFLDKEVGRLKEREGEDKELEREKKRVRKEKRKRREREEREMGGGVELVPFEGEDDGSEGFSGGEDEGFDRDSVEDLDRNDGRSKRGKLKTDERKLEDLEAIASGLLG